jgi:soluble cytochrome b562
MNKKQLHEQSLKELRKLEYIFEEESTARPVATSVKSHLESLGYETKRTMAEVGDLTPEFGDTLKDVGSAFKQKLPDLKIKFGSGRDLFHKAYPNSRHNKGNAIDVVFKGIEKGDDDELNKISTLLCALRKKYPGFTFIDEYRRPSRFSTGVHYHLSYSDSKTDEGGGTSQFCSSLKNLDNLEDIDFEKIDDLQTTEKTKDPNKLEKFLDYIGLGSLTDIKSGDKESQKELVSKVQDKEDVKDTDDGFEIFGYNVDDIINKIDDILPQFESEQKRKNILENLEIRDISGMSTYGRKNEKLKSRDFFVIHHTAGRGDAEKVVGILNSRKGGLGVQWVIERDGSIVRTLPSGSRGAHTLNSSDFPSAPQGINNSNAEGVEVIGMNDEDILPVQAVSALKLVKSLGYSPDSIYGHGEINPGHKAKTEGQTIKQFILKNWGNNESDYDYSMFENRGIDIEAETKNIKEPSKLDSFLDAVGLGSLTGAKSGDKESQKELVSKVENEKDVKDTGDGFEIFGYKVDDILDKIGDLLPQFESEEKKKNILEDIENIKSKMIK